MREIVVLCMKIGAVLIGFYNLRLDIGAVRQSADNSVRKERELFAG